MKNMMRALLVFLVGCLILAVVIYVLNLVIAMLVLPPAVAHIALIIIGLPFAPTASRSKTRAAATGRTARAGA